MNLPEQPYFIRPVVGTELWCDNRHWRDVGRGTPSPWGAYQRLRVAGRATWPPEMNARIGSHVGRVIQSARTVLACHWPDLRRERLGYDFRPGELSAAAGLGAVVMAVRWLEQDGWRDACGAPPERAPELLRLMRGAFGRSLKDALGDDLGWRIAIGTLCSWRCDAIDNVVRILGSVWRAAYPDTPSGVRWWVPSADWPWPGHALREYEAALAAVHRRSERTAAEGAQLALPLDGRAA